MSDVYIVTSGSYSDYGIDRVFKSRKKAELYCECHEGCEVEEWDFNDDSIYTVYDYVNVIANIYTNRNELDVVCNFMKGAMEDNPLNRDKLFVFSYISPAVPNARQKVTIDLSKELPKNYSKMQVEHKWKRLIEDLAVEIRYEFANVDKVNDKVMREFVERRLGVKEERVDD